MAALVAPAPAAPRLRLVSFGDGKREVLLLDEHYPPHLAELLLRRGHPAMCVAGHPQLEGATDERLYLHAANAAMRIVTENVADFAQLAKAASNAGASQAALLLVSSRRHPRTGKSAQNRLADQIASWLAANPLPTRPIVAWLP